MTGMRECGFTGRVQLVYGIAGVRDDGETGNCGLALGTVAGGAGRRLRGEAGTYGGGTAGHRESGRTDSRGYGVPVVRGCGVGLTSLRQAGGGASLRGVLKADASVQSSKCLGGQLPTYAGFSRPSAAEWRAHGKAGKRGQGSRKPAPLGWFCVQRASRDGVAPFCVTPRHDGAAGSRDYGITG